jgi:hypothetical protein
MLALYDAERTRLLRASAVVCAMAILLLPIAAQSSRTIEPALSGAAPFVVPTVPPAIARAPLSGSVRDPFRPTVDDGGGDRAISPVLLAFADGVRPVALVEIDGRAEAIEAGGQAFGSRVVYVDAKTVRLTDGRTFALRTRT